MDFIRDDIWQSIQHHLPEDFDSPKEVEKALVRLKKHFPDYYQQIRELLDGHDSASRYFGNLNQSIMQSAQPEDQMLKTGDQIGTYRIIRRLSSGGMTHVYMAERSDGDFNQLVAIKVMKQNISGELLKEYFQREKQILADLNHPNIANIYDGGITEEDRPYLVMEYIAGLPVTEYCDRNRLTIEQRIKLFHRICQAVNHAHQNLVIHKDLKPGNIFVDENGNIKLMDFGVAHILDESQANTPEGIRAFTPAWASPEQIKNQKITTASDIYQLGLLFFQLIIGVHRDELDEGFFSGKTLLTKSMVIQKKKDRILYARKLNRLRDYDKKIRGDLQAVMIKALQSKPEERYASVQDLRHDLQHFFDKQPLSARKPTFFYIFSKYYRRNRLKINIGAASLIIFLIISIQHNHQLNHERNIAQKNAVKARFEAKRAESVISYMKNLIGMGNPYINDNQNLSLNKILSTGFNNLIHTSDIESHTKAEILLTLGEVFRERGDYSKSHQAIKRARSIKRSLYPSQHGEMSSTYSQLSKTHLLAGRLDSARYYIDQALQIDTMAGHLNTPPFTGNLEQLGNVLYHESRYQRAMKIYHQVFRKLNNLVTDNRKDRARLFSSIGDTHHQMGQYDSARIYLHRAKNIHSQFADSSGAYIIDDLSMLANTYLRTESLDSAELFIHQALSKGMRVYGKNSGELEYILALASRIAKKQQKYGQALSYAKKALTINTNQFGPKHIYTAQRMNTVGLVYRDFGKMKQAEHYFRKALEIKEKYYPNEKKSISIGQYNLAVSLLKQHQHKAAMKLLKKVRTFEKQIYPENHPYRAYTLIQLARGHLELGHMERASRNMYRAYEIVRTGLDSIHSLRGTCLEVMAEYFIKEQKWALASQYAAEGMTIYSELYGNKHWKYAYTSALKTLAEAGARGTDGTDSPAYASAFDMIREDPHADPYLLGQLRNLSTYSP
ncbi:MAG: serine/threonine protein kinase [Bacteroidales bacterium]|nr:serine/threonine protein kinase [Bacteroidales bacterium]